MSRIFIILCLFFSFGIVFGQNTPIIDSLLQIVEHAKHDSDRVNALNDLGRVYIQTEMDKAEKILQKANTIATRIKFTQGILDSKNRLGVLYYQQGKNTQALEMYNQCMLIVEKKKDSAFIGKLLANISLVQIQLGEFDIALENLLKAQPIEEKFAPNRGNAHKIDIANIYYFLDRKEESLAYAYSALEGATALNDPNGIAVSNSAIGMFLNSLERFDESLPYLYKSLEYFKMTGNKMRQINNMLNISNVFTHNENYEMSVSILDSIIVVSREIGDNNQEINALTNLGSIYSILEDYPKANENFLAAYKISQNNNIIKLELELTGKLAVSFERLGEFGKSIDFYQKQNVLQKKLFSEDVASAVLDANTKYETEKKEKENELLKTENALKKAEIEAEKDKQRFQNSIFIGLFILLFLVVVFIFYRKKSIEKAKVAKLEKQRFKAVIEAEEKERVRIARELHDGLGQLLSTAKLNVASLEGSVDKEDEVLVSNSMSLIDEAVKEVRSISHNMMPFALSNLGLVPALKQLITKINDSGLLAINSTFMNMENRLNSSTEIAVYRVVQEILNNMIKHSKANEINIIIEKTNRRLLLQISDNGIGFDTNKIEESKGIGWKNIFSRISLLNGNVDVNSSPGKGTDLIVSVPVS